MVKYIKSEKGMALPTVIMVMLISFTLCASVLALADSQTRTEITYESSTKALHAAEAGINYYLWGLNKDEATVELNTVIKYPDINPEYAFILKDKVNDAGLKEITSTGWALHSPDITRSINATLRKKTFTEHVYFTDTEDSNIVWTSGEVCYGPLHTNTSLNISGIPKFFGKVTYVESLNGYQQKDKHNIFIGGEEKIPYMQKDVDNSHLMTRAKTNGYYFEGRTSIMMNPDGTLDIWCVKGTNPNGENPTLVNTTDVLYNCPLPENGVIYVNVHGSGNDTSGTFNENAGNAFVSGKLSGRLTIASNQDIYITDYNPTKKYYNQRGPETNGVTYANIDFQFVPSQNKHDVIGTGDDMLGLVANRDVLLLTRGWFKDGGTKYKYYDWTQGKEVEVINEDEYTGRSAHGDINVHAAVMAMNGSFGNPNYTYSPNTNPQGKVILRGSLIQDKRAAVGQGSTGYKKDYSHDTRMFTTEPPYFPQPVNAGWEITSWE